MLIQFHDDFRADARSFPNGDVHLHFTDENMPLRDVYPMNKEQALEYADLIKRMALGLQVVETMPEPPKGPAA